MAKNSEVYKTAQERAEAFNNFCDSRDCTNCELCSIHESSMHGIVVGRPVCSFAFLDLEAEDEKLDSCFYCGHSTEVVPTNNGRTFAVKCTNELCGYQSGSDNRHDTIAAHNRVAKAVRESEGK